MKNAFVCCTPFHILVSLHLVESVYKDTENDIFISDHFSSAYEVYQRLEKSGKFHSVYYVRDKEISYDKSFFRLRKFKNLWKRNSSSVLDNFISEPKYDEVFLYTYSYFSVLLADLCKSKFQSNINMVEEGIMTYSLGNYRSDFIKSILNKFLRIFDRFYLNYDGLDSVYLFSKDLYSGKRVKKIKEIPNIPVESNFKNMINDIFNYEPQSEYNNSKIIFFDQSFSQDGNTSEVENNVLQILLEHCDKGNVLIKLHPRDKPDKFGDNISFRINNANYPWEVVYLNENIDNHILLAVSSSALFTPKIIYGAEPKIVLLYKLLNVEVNSGFEDFISLLQTTYTKNNVFIPSNIQELQQVLQQRV